MGQVIEMTAEDGHALSAYRADPEGSPKGGLVVVQKIFGVNNHIRGVCDRFAAAGYATLAPAVFDRVRRDVALDYTPAGIAEGRRLVGELDWDGALRDIAAAATALADAGKAGVVGYCWGGTVAWLAARSSQSRAARVAPAASRPRAALSANHNSSGAGASDASIGS